MAEYKALAQELYVAYFGRPTGETARAMAESMKSVTIVASAPDRHYGPSAKDARRAQIKRNGGKR